MSTVADSLGRFRGPAGKADALVKHCFYMIAMGTWLPGRKLPAVRRVEEEWSLNRQTILKAYNTLAQMGLVEHRPNAGYYVVEHEANRGLIRDRIELERVFEKALRTIEAETGLFPLAVFRHLAEMAESKMAERPEVAFVECSRSQAVDHAGEIEERLGIPILPLSLDDIRGERFRLPPHVRIVLTTSFHIDELKHLEDEGYRVRFVPIRMSTDLLEEMASREEPAVFLESSDAMAFRTSNDATWMLGIDDPKVEVADDIGGFLRSRIEAGGGAQHGTLFIVAQKEWERLDADLKRLPFVRPITCQLSESAWPIVYEALRIPFGPLA